MQNLFVVAMTDTFEQLIGEAFDDHRIHAFFFAKVPHKLFQIEFQVLKNKDEFAVSMDYLAKTHYVGMI